MLNRLRIPSMSCLLTVMAWTSGALAQEEPIYDEDLLPEYTLPDPLTLGDGTPVRDARTWNDRRRPEILRLFEEHVYGRAPAGPEVLKFDVFDNDPEALGGKAIRKQVAITLAGDEDPLVMTVLIYQPKTDQPVPLFLGLNFYGNHTISDDPGIQLNPNWMRASKEKGVVDNRATEASRGTSKSRWPIEMLIDRGYALATIYCGDVDPDFDDGFQNGIHPYFYREGQERPTDGQWGTIAAWAWGLSRAVDYFEQDETIDAERVAVMGHSRLGKTSLWAGATDPRFAIVISNNSGCGGAALSRRRYGESVRRINTSFPHWFCENFKQYNGNEGALPVDQHMLIALMAPRPVYVASAVEDRWADPRGEFLSARHADPVYRLLGTDGFGGDAPPERQPPIDEPLKFGTIGYHIRSGRHNVTDFDWQQYLDFADLHLDKSPGTD